MKKISLIIAFVAGVLLLSSCLKDDDVQPTPVAGLTMVNGFIPSEAVIYGMDGRAIQNSYNPLFYRTYGYTNLYVGASRRMEIYAYGAQNALADTTFETKDSTYYTSFIYGTADAPLHFITEDHIPDGVADPAAIAAVRFYNLANTVYQITLKIGDTEVIPAFQDRPTETPETGKADENFVEVPKGTYTLTVENEDGEVVATREGIELPAGSYTTIFLTGDESIDNSYYVAVVRQGVT